MGDFIVCLCDDITLDPEWLKASLVDTLLGTKNDVVAVGFGTQMKCFDRVMANFPLCRRSTIEKHWKHFYPYAAGWGDVSFSMAVWESGGCVVQGPDKPVHFRSRENHPESPHKIMPNHFHNDTKTFLSDHREMADEWMEKHCGLWCYDTRLPRPTY
jgi:hypothetical protein